MVNVRDSIVATLVYYDIFDLPLTFAEIYRYLINPNRFSGKRGGDFKIETAGMLRELDSLVRSGTIGYKNGFYFMPGGESLYEERIERDKIANKKWKKFLTVAKYLQAAPYLRAVFVSGSLAANNPEPKSDFDVLVVIKSGRLYTGRLFLWIISSVTRARRGRFDVIAPDKLCFNHYLTDNNLELAHRSLYVAQSLTNLRPVIFSGGVVDGFTSSNRWANSCCYNFGRLSEYRSIKTNKAMLALARAGEILLNNSLGDLIEKILKAIQQKRIRKNPATYESGGRIVFTDTELEFHPRSFEKTVIAAYNRNIKKLGILSPEEKDSGLAA